MHKSHIPFSVCKKINKKLLEELITYFALIRHGLHRKRRLEQFFVGRGSHLPRRYSNVKGMHRPTDSGLRCRPYRNDAPSSYFVLCVRFLRNIFTGPLFNAEWNDTLNEAVVLQR
jgi:hypothetical protein